MAIKGIIFDYGGTLDTGGDHWSRVIRDGWVHAGVMSDDARFREAYVYGERELEREEHILPHHTFRDILNIKIELGLLYLSQTGYFAPAMIESKAKEIADYCYGVASRNVSQSKIVLEELAKKYPLVLVSNFYGNIETVLEEFGISGCFKKVIESAKVGIRKPSSGIFELGIKALDLKPEEVLVVGDSEKNDIKPAEKLGCHTLLLEGRGWEGKTDEAELSVTPLDGKSGRETIKKLDEIMGYLENAQLT